MARKPTRILLDSGADINCISREFYLKNKDILSKYRLKELPNILLTGPTGNVNYEGSIRVPVNIGTQTFRAEFLVVEKLPVPVLLGSKTQTQQGIDLLNSKMVVTLRDGTRIPYLKQSAGEEVLGSVHTIHATNELRLPPGCETLVLGRVSRVRPSDKLRCLLITAQERKAGRDIVAAKGIGYLHGRETLVGIANLGTQEIHIKPGDILGKCKLVKESDFEVHPLGDINNPTVGKDSRHINLIVQAAQALAINSESEKTSKPDEPVSEEELARELDKLNLPYKLNIGIKDLKRSQLHSLLEVLKNFQDTFAKDPDNPGSVDPSVAVHTIDTGDAKPIGQAPRRLSPQKRKVVKEHIDKLLKAGIISPSRSPWASPVLLVPKGENGFRMCIDYRKLNAVTKKEIFALPRIDDIFDSIAGAQWFSTLDLASGYHQIPLDESSKDKSAFVTYDGAYRFNFMSFGLVNAPSTFQRCMDAVLAGLKWNCVQIYLDDAIIASKSFDQHIIDLTAVLTRFKEAGFKLKASKCHFCVSEIKYLGHLVTREGIRANPEKVALIRNWEIPRDAKNLHSFLGLCGYYRRLISNFAQRERALRLVLRESEFKMTPEAIASFRDLQRALMSDPIICLPDFSGKSKFELHTDASDFGISAILCQINPEGKEQVIQYASRMLTKQELKWHTQEKEALAIVWGCLKFRPYLQGTKFIIRTDHHSLQWLMRSEKGRLARWALSLSEFNYTIVHRQGRKNINADIASRWTKEAPDESWDPFPHYSEALPLEEAADREQMVNVVCARCVEPPPMGRKQPNPNLKQRVLTLVNMYEHIKRAQGEHDRIKQLVNNIKISPVEEDRKYLQKRYKWVKRNGLLGREVIDAMDGKDSYQIVIPREAKSLIKDIIHAHHNPNTMGHFGRHRTLAKIRRYYYWPGMQQDCKEYIKTCAECQAHKTPAPNKYGHQLHPSLPNGPNARISIDLIGPLPTTAAGYKYGLIMIDYFTKWTVVVPISNKGEKEVAEAIYKHWYCKFGIPFEIQTDQGNEFTNDLLKRINSRLNIGHQVTTPYNPSPNGQVENFNRTLKASLSIYAEDHPSNWDCFIEGIAWAYNSSLHRQTGFSPFYLMYGREPRLPTDVLGGRIMDIRHDWDQYQTNLTCHLRDAYEIVTKRITEEAKKAKEAWDRKIHKSYTTFKEGDLVLMYKDQTHIGKDQNAHEHVWKRKWQGPFKVIRQKYADNKDVYVIKDEESSREWTINVNKLRKYNPRLFLSNDDVGILVKPTSKLPNSIPTSDGDVLQAGDDRASNEITGPQGRIPNTAASDPSSNHSFKGAHRHRTGITKKELARQLERQLTEQEPDLTQEAVKEYVIERIVNHRRGQGGRMYYEFKWEGYPDSENTWETAEAYTTPGQKLLHEYWADKPRDQVPRAFRTPVSRQSK